MHIISATLYEENEGWGHASFVQDYDLLLLVTGGELIYTINGDSHHLSAGHVLLLPHGTRREGAGVRSKSHRKMAVRFQQNDASSDLPMIAMRKPIVYPTAKLSFWNDRMYTLLKHWSEKQPYYPLLCTSILNELLVTVYNEHHTHTHTVKPYLRMVREYITTHFNSPLDIGFLAQLADKKKSYLITSFRNHYGEPPIAYMHQLRIAEAEKLLISTNASIESIADQLGYCDASYFNRMFRQRVGLSPAKYRLQHK
ncbi:hypothetical protein SY83_02560 [Paenibacillus swuensis]|uniref:HTH araC/xylS-type domain-containing protein n=1 Tax=Paenibacillus swuensis TaxID=1178515 RepID=A0A172TEB2_9BACL|nr:AraC family transcriptional regulator [Paenibacillus swuensis]ANE45389.1 hypothetical protein SY83_02560 [Paenibacillus swuensis]